ncbi:class A beta-lactamase-related serine hydrolase [Mycolicibacterium smegmatis]|uniref:serine hydrolase n=1 Tax=Mycolicibacterium smegmatis TaxID=1772 RepID=UPI001E5C827B|nr:serine hydrolase [Mycolicibacterium smegmatis]UGU29337.1 class A beta-lactamase-related serine hydrolase [Mycolicibacterium smegmatis]ULN70301.1 class A beta-lactamase-related serine hydrolase [Mycolicibacterium smegmatis]
MRRRQPKSVMTGMAVVACAALLVSGCTAPAGGAPPAVEHTPQATVAPPAAPPPVQPPASFAGLDARMQQATADAAASGATIEAVVLDRNTGEVVSNGSNKPFPIASVVKLFIADDLLLQESEGKTELSPADRKSLDVMLRSSDDSAAQMFWDRLGGNAVISRIKARYGLPGTIAPYNGHWDVTQSTAADLVHYYDMLLNGGGGLPREQADVIVDNLAHFTPSGTDGYPQRFGIPDGLSGEAVAVKQGWFCCWNRADQLHVSTGIIGPDHRYLMAISSLDPTSAGAARENITEAVRTMFPGGKI